ncbi:MAG: hypothetical protein A2X64_09565 [Ignavibacteria bacterium GWF2_33_9]|nr:MAG: hypothetical protein A2X64_09565 [Ignavibacteria bacterium GWF2_33_9]
MSCGEYSEEPYSFKANFLGTYYGDVKLHISDSNHYMYFGYESGRYAVLKNNSNLEYPDLPPRTIICDIYKHDTTKWFNHILRALSRYEYDEITNYYWDHDDLNKNKDTVIQSITLYECEEDSISIIICYKAKSMSFGYIFYGAKVKEK